MWMGFPGIRMVPCTGCSASTIMSRAAICGDAATSRTLATLA